MNLSTSLDELALNTGYKRIIWGKRSGMTCDSYCLFVLSGLH
jgi:hypothetical protein